jgi:hypothetical protein
MPRMNSTLQERMLQGMMNNTRWANVDIHAHMDRRLRLDENMANIQHQFGISHRNKGMEHIQQHNAETERARKFRESHPQRGVIQTPAGLAMDAARHALAPGRRVSRTGNTYYERRENRSDRNYHQRL